MPWSTHILLGLRIDSPKIFWKALVIAVPFLPFKGTTYAYLLKISMTPNKNQNCFLYLVINSIPATLAPQNIVFKRWGYFTFFKLPNNWLVNSSANYWFEIISLLIADLSHVAVISERALVTVSTEDFLSKKLYTNESRPFWYPSYFGLSAI